MLFHEATLQESNANSSVISDSLALMKKKGFPENEVADFAEKAVHILDNCSVSLGTGTQFRYVVDMHLSRVRLRIILMKPLNSPLSNADDTIDSISEFVTQLFLSDNSAFVSCRNIQNRTIITLYSAVMPRKKPSLKSPTLWFKSPLLWAIIMGVIGGLICQRLPDNTRSFLVDGLAEPIGSVVLALIAGITGPVIFLSLITSITSLGSVSKLTDLGFKIMWRFIKCTLFIIAVSIAVSLLFYSAFGSGSIQFTPDQLVSMLLKLIPTNIIAPFLNNDTPQLVILGLFLGAALLFAGGSRCQPDHFPALPAGVVRKCYAFGFCPHPSHPLHQPLQGVCHRKHICFAGRLGVHRRRIRHSRHLLSVQADKGLSQVQAQHQGTAQKDTAGGFPGLLLRI